MRNPFAQNESEEEVITVTLSRLGSSSVSVDLEEGSTIQDALTKARWTLSAGEKCYVGNIPGEMHFEVEDGDSIQIIGSKVGGIK